MSIANGKTTPVIGKRSITLTNSLNLESILIMSSLDYNLVSISQLMNTLSWVVIFWLNFCVIKDVQIRQTIGYGVKWEKLYYLDLKSKDLSKLQQTLTMAYTKGEKTSLRYGCGIMLHLAWKCANCQVILKISIP